jgi:hypothetical protein
MKEGRKEKREGGKEGKLFSFLAKEFHNYIWPSVGSTPSL